MPRTWLLFALWAVLFQSCSDGNAESRMAKEHQREKELREKELHLKEEELKLKQQQEAGRNSNRSLSEYYDREKDAVWMIYARNDEQVAQGSGFVINESGLAISNNHVFENATEYIAINSKGERFNIDAIYQTDADVDYAIFHIEGAGEPFAYVPIATKQPHVGEDCFAIGNPEGLTLTLSKGIVSGIREEGKLIQTTAEITHGSSGGPLFNAQGEVVGITTSGMERANLNFAVDIHHVPFERWMRSGRRPAATTQGTSTGSRTPIDQAQQVIDQYFASSKRRDYQAVTNCLAPVLNAFYANTNISREEAVAKSMDYDTRKGIRVVSYEIKWASAERKVLSDGYYFRFVMDYSITSTDPKLPHDFVLECTAGLDRSFHINFMKQKVLSKS